MIYEPIRMRSAQLTRSTLTSALRAQASKNKLAFAKHPLAQGTRARLRHVVPVNVLNITAAVADEMVVAHAFQVESPGAAFDRHFPHQACLHQVTQIVVGRSSRRARIY